MKNLMLSFRKYVLTLTMLVIAANGFAQDSTSTATANTHYQRVAVFAPLYLDSVFSGNYFRYGKKFPRFVLQGLDFVQGMQIAFDSMPALPNGARIKASMYDSKSEKSPIAKLIADHTLDSVQLIIGSVREEEYQLLARFAAEKHIPFISATYPNDGGVTANPFLAIATSTLKAHCEAIFSFMLQNHGTDNLIHVRQAGSQEDRVAGYFNSINKQDGKPLLNIRTLNIDSNFYLIKNYLDSNRNNIIVGGSLDEDFAHALTLAASSMKIKYNITLIGMPNWDGFASLHNPKKSSLNDFPFYFTSPYYNSKADNYSRMVQDAYLKKYKGKPSEFSYKGFEMGFTFTRILSMYPNDFMSHMNDYAFKIFSEFNFRPVFLSKNTTTPDYFENKHLYFLKKQNGQVTKAW